MSRSTTTAKLLYKNPYICQNIHAMKNLLLFVLVCCLFACKKKDTPSPANDFYVAWDSLHMNFEKKYWFTNLPSAIKVDTLIFHHDKSLTEIKPDSGSITYTPWCYNYVNTVQVGGTTESSVIIKYHLANESPNGFYLHDDLLKDTVLMYSQGPVIPGYISFGYALTDTTK